MFPNRRGRNPRQPDESRIRTEASSMTLNKCCAMLADALATDVPDAGSPSENFAILVDEVRELRVG